LAVGEPAEEDALMDAALQAEAKEFLLSIPVFGGLPDTAMDRLLPLIQVRQHKKGEVICAEGELGREMYVIRIGEVEVHKHARDSGRVMNLAKMRVGDCFGEMSLIDIQPRSATVSAAADTTIYVINNMDLLGMYEADLAAYTFLVQNICRELSRRLRRADGIIADFFLRLEQYVGDGVD
jgi:CRP-like cAMP-binding protein